MRRYWIAGLVAVLVGAFLFPTAASAKQDKVDVCHFDEDTATYVLINIPQKAADKHIANHGDGYPGDAVPGAPAYIFGVDCVPTPRFLAVAYSNLNGVPGYQESSADVLIAGIIDVDGSGSTTVGDIVELGQAPQDHTPTAFLPFQNTQHEISNVVAQDNQRIVVNTPYPNQSAVGCRFSFSIDQDIDRFREDVLFSSGSTLANGWFDFHDRTHGDQIYQSLSSTTACSGELPDINGVLGGNGGEDSTFIDVDIN